VLLCAGLADFYGLGSDFGTWHRNDYRKSEKLGLKKIGVEKMQFGTAFLLF
jgi:hypothetical protein